MRIRELRERAGLTQIQLADAIGVVPSAVSRWESGENMPSAARVMKLADKLHCTIDELYGRANPAGVAAARAENIQDSA